MFRIIYTIIRHKSVDVHKLQFAILARSPREMSQTDRIIPRYILSRVRVSVRPRILVYAKKTANHSRPARRSRSPLFGRYQLNWNGHNPFSWVAQRQELSAKTLLRSLGTRVSIPVQGTIFCFTFIVCD